MSYLLAYNPYNTNLFMRTRSIDPAAQDFIDAAGITGDVQQQAINNLVKGLKADEIWSKMKAVYPFVTDNRNLFPYTSDLSTWTTGDVTKTLNYATAPDGTNTAIRIQGTTNAWFLGADLPTTVASNKVFSVYIKSNTGSNQQFRFFYQNTPVSGNYTVTTSWQRLEFTVNTITTSGQLTGFCRDSANNTADLLIWHPQAEEGTVATAYQPIATTQQAYIASQFKYNLVNPVDSDAAFRLVFNGGWTHSSTGATPNGTNGYADTKLVPSSVLAQNNSHISHYSRTNSQSNKPSIHSFSNVGGSKGEFAIYPYYTGNVAYSSISGDTASSITTSLNSLNYYIANRISATSDSLFTGLIKASRTIASISPSTSPIFIAAQSFNGAPSPGFYDIRQSAFATIGDGLLDSEATALYNRVQQFQVSLSRQV